MKTTYKKSTAFIICLLIPLLISAQQINTLYFMNNVPQRNVYNPAFQPRCGFYIDLPITPNLKLDIGNNSFSINSFVFTQKINGVDSTITFLHPDADKQAFLDKIRPTTRLFTDFQVNLFEFGFRAKKSYLSFGVKERIENSIYLPKDIFRLALFGTPETETDNSFDFKTFGVNTSLFTEFALGYSYKINKSLTVGTKLKALVGQANISTNISTLSLKASMDRWLLKGNATINSSTPIEIPLDNENNFDFQNITLPDLNQTFFMNQLNADNLGYGIDLGVTFRPVKFLQLSAALTDLGYIRWTKGITSATINGEYEFDGVNIDLTQDNINLQEIGQQYLDELTNAFTITPNKDAYTTFLTTKLNIGAEVSALNDKIGVGLLSRTMFANKSMFEELTASINLRPLTWLSASASYSLVDGEYSTIGVGLQFRLGMINMYIAGDYMPARFTTDFIPTRQKQVNLEAGINWQFGNHEKHKKSENAKKQKKIKEKTVKKEGLKFPMFITYEEKIKDNDNDGVKNKKDKCPDTPKGYLVDEFGCTVDTDKDGIADNVDKCPNTPSGVKVDSIGCPVDTDKDKIPDYLDKCPNTPLNVIVDENGCPIDTDKDGIADYLDKCPDTPTDVVVDTHGCPVDSDKDGVPDYLDKCPNTPEKAHGTIDNNGCPKDSDGDGVPDYLDKCADTPKEAFGKIDANGCVLDTDGDGFPDYKDNCPTIPGVESNHGCPEIKAEIKRVFQQALQGIQFETGKDVIKPTSFGILNQIVKIMNDNPDYLLLINGHTDNVGNATLNQALSEKRANAVKKYLIQKGISSERMTAQGFGDSMPVADNATTKGKALNRRVEFVVKFEK